MSRTESELTALADAIRADGGTARTVVCDVSDPAAIEAVVPPLGRIDVLVNNAGTNIPEPFLDVSLEHLDTILNLNVRGAFLMAQAVVRGMRERGHGGSIIHMSSQMGHVGAPIRTAYCASKHAIEGLTKAMGSSSLPTASGSTLSGPPLSTRRLPAASSTIRSSTVTYWSGSRWAGWRLPRKSPTPCSTSRHPPRPSLPEPASWSMAAGPPGSTDRAPGHGAGSTPAPGQIPEERTGDTGQPGVGTGDFPGTCNLT